MSDDEAFALDHAYTLAGDEARQHFAWMRAVSRRLVHESAYLIEPLADALLKHRVLSGQHAEAVIAAHRKGTSHAHLA